MTDFFRNLVVPIFEGEELIHVVTLRSPSLELVQKIRLEARSLPEQSLIEGVIWEISALSGLSVETLNHLDLRDLEALTLGLIPILERSNTMLEQMVALTNAPDTPDKKRH